MKVPGALSGPIFTVVFNSKKKIEKMLDIKHKKFLKW